MKVGCSVWRMVARECSLTNRAPFLVPHERGVQCWRSLCVTFVLFPSSIPNDWVLDDDMRYDMKLGRWSPLLRLFTAKPANSYIEVQEERLICSFGTATQTIPRADVVSVIASNWPWYHGIGWRMGPMSLCHIGSLIGIVEIRLSSVRKSEGLLKTRYDRFFVSLEEPEAFIDAMSEAEAMFHGELI